MKVIVWAVVICAVTFSGFIFGFGYGERFRTDTVFLLGGYTDFKSALRKGEKLDCDLQLKIDLAILSGRQVLRNKLAWISSVPSASRIRYRVYFDELLAYRIANLSLISCRLLSDDVDEILNLTGSTLSASAMCQDYESLPVSDRRSP